MVTSLHDTKKSPMLSGSNSLRKSSSADAGAFILSASALRYAYRGIPAVTEIGFSVAEGSITALIGANGAGKTTSVKMAAGALRPDAGRVLFEGRDITGLPAHQVVDLGITLVPEGRLIFPAMTVRENLQIGATAPRAAADAERNMERIFDLFPRLAERRDQYAGSMSGGEQQMLAIGRGLMANPRLLILDEPSLGLSPKFVQHIFDLITKLNAEGISILLVEQNVNQALAIAQHAFVLEKGRVVKSGNGRALLNDPAVREAFLGGL
jgi:branched-chain amino acid transport system ATP-binding protein